MEIKWNHQNIFNIKASRRRRKRKEQMDHKETSGMVDFNTNISIIILNISGLNTVIKRQRLSDGLNRQNPTLCYP